MRRGIQHLKGEDDLITVANTLYEDGKIKKMEYSYHMVKGINWTQQASINRRTDNSQRFQKWLSRRMYRDW
jgi:starvation-inducible outer membrane lipoprotein